MSFSAGVASEPSFPRPSCAFLFTRGHPDYYWGTGRAHYLYLHPIMTYLSLCRTTWRGRRRR
ncbi:hypothetical protein FA13DRAFT_1275428 [Coprinellus micaceus]|uniref:Uncharacterized protein n=1 Tax=Coprinellus micaceus TaxID=71717 RepID=A0A4Y7R821_COPMI|nr:hypothetical protein FA13DRAFT_1275428 [Coprinellus micaceus]